MDAIDTSSFGSNIQVDAGCIQKEHLPATVVGKRRLPSWSSVGSTSKSSSRTPGSFSTTDTPSYKNDCGQSTVSLLPHSSIESTSVCEQACERNSDHIGKRILPPSLAGTRRIRTVDGSDLTGNLEPRIGVPDVEFCMNSKSSKVNMQDNAGNISAFDGNISRTASGTRRLPPSLVGGVSSSDASKHGASKLKSKNRLRANVVDQGPDRKQPEIIDIDSLDDEVNELNHVVDSEALLGTRALPSSWTKMSRDSSAVWPTRHDNKQARVLDNDSYQTSRMKGFHNVPSSNHYISRGVQGDEILINGNVTSRRQLPATLSGPKPVNGSSSVGSGSDNQFVPMVDERDIFRSALQGLSQPTVEANLPDGLMSVPLLRHQKIALAWMVQRETTPVHCSGGILADDQGLGKTISTIALILMQNPQRSKCTVDSKEEVRESLDLDNDDDHAFAECDLRKEHSYSGTSCKNLKIAEERSKRKGRLAAGTLIVCPASVLRQWSQELHDKVADPTLSVLMYYGSDRTRDPDELIKYDIVLTTYSLVCMEVPKQPLSDEDDKERKQSEKYGISDFYVDKRRKSYEHKNKKGKKNKKCRSSVNSDMSPLAQVLWFRVVLDEAQIIKNYRTQVSRACCRLRAKRRWCLSGTPIQNSIDDLFSYFRFLRHEPYSFHQTFNSAIKHLITQDPSKGYKKLQAILTTIMLRRTKGTYIDGKPIIYLPPKYISLKKVDFSAEERAFYLNLEAESRKQFQALAASGRLKENYANILLLLLRLRQACDHPVLVKGFVPDNREISYTEAALHLSLEECVSLLSQLESSLAVCNICIDLPEDPVVTRCLHVFCKQCIFGRLTSDESSCPLDNCKAQIHADSLYSRDKLLRNLGQPASSEDVETSEKLNLNPSAITSSKIKAVIDILQSLRKTKLQGVTSTPMESVEVDSSASCSNLEHSKNLNLQGDQGSARIPDKAIIFSQWTGMLNLIEMSLRSSGIEYRRLDGTMTLAARDKAVKDFNTLEQVTVMIMSLKAGNLGLNMVAANHIILLDLWWNPTTEDQAIDRAHRIGQTRPVFVSRLTVKDTIEDRILALQEKKRKMIESAFGEEQRGGVATQLTIDDLRYLFMDSR